MDMSASAADEAVEDVPNPEVLLKSDFDRLCNPERLAEGLLLVDPTSADKRGRVIFTLGEIPPGVVFETANQNWLKKQQQKVVYLGAPGISKTMSIPVETTVTSGNKDTFLMSALQSDLCVMNDAVLLQKIGITLQEQISGTPKTIRSLEDLPVDVKYFTENGSIVHRCSEHLVRVGDKAISVGKASADDSSELASEVNKILFDETPSETPGSVPAASNDLGSKVASLLVQSPDFPRVTSLVVSGSGYHTESVECQYIYQGGVEGSSTMRWERSAGSENVFLRIAGATSLVYQPSVADVGALIRVAYTPVRADGVTGAIVFSQPIAVQVGPAVQEEVDANAALSTLMFKALLINGEEFQKRTISLNRRKVKVRKRRATLSKMEYGPTLRVIPHSSNECQFTLQFGPNGDSYDFITPSRHQRDMTVLTIARFNVLYHCTPEEEASASQRAMLASCR